MRADTATKVAYRESPDGDWRITSETAFNDKVTKATTEKTALPEQRSSGTFGYKYAETVDEAVELSGGRGVGEYEDVEVFLAVFNYGAGLRQHGAAKDILLSDNFEAWEGVKDVSFAIAEKVERSKMSVEEKTFSLLKKAGYNITPDQLRAALASIQQPEQAASA